MCIALHVHIHVHVHVYCEAVLSILHVLLHTVKLLLLFCDYSIVKVHKFTCTVDVTFHTRHGSKYIGTCT